MDFITSPTVLFMIVLTFQVLNKTPQYLELDGNLEVVKKSKKQPSVFFRALRANGVPIVVRIRNTNEDPTGRLAFMQEQMLPKGQGHRVQDPVCSTIVTLPVDVVPDAPGEAEDDEDLENRIPGLLNTTIHVFWFYAFVSFLMLH